ncbi:MAG: hypothetical protein V4555_12235, partial [Acidobacteriota bacterium]
FLLSSDPHSTNTLLSGDVLAQSGAFTNATMTGNYVISFESPFGGDGVSTIPTQSDSAIFFGAIDSGHANISLTGDENKAGSLRLNQNMGSVSYSVDANGRMTLDPSAGVLFYLANSSQGFGVVQTQSVGDTDAILNLQQQAAIVFSNASVNGTFAFGTSPQPVINSTNTGVLISPGDGTASVTADAAQNTGILAANQSNSYTFTVGSNGRTTATDAGGGSSILYLIDTNNAIILTTNPGDTAPALVWLQR